MDANGEKCQSCGAQWTKIKPMFSGNATPPVGAFIFCDACGHPHIVVEDGIRLLEIPT